MKKRKIIVANWKMNVFTEKEAKKIVSEVKTRTINVKNTDIVFCPNPVFLPSLYKMSSKKYLFGVQDVSAEERGSFTGQSSFMHFKPYKVKFSIIGHSERRKIGENDELINKKTKICLNNGIFPIVCIGEEFRDEHGGYLDFIKNQIKSVFTGIPKNQIIDVVLAYEPLWAIGASSAMKPEDVFEMYLWIKKCLKETVGTVSDNIKILYGGAVDDKNSRDIINIGSVDGFLVGRASLDPKAFSEIIKNSEK